MFAGLISNRIQFKCERSYPKQIIDYKLVMINSNYSDAANFISKNNTKFCINNNIKSNNCKTTSTTATRLRSIVPSPARQSRTESRRFGLSNESDGKPFSFREVRINKQSWR